MSLPTDDPADIRDDSDPLLLFANEPEVAAPTQPVVEIPNEVVVAGPPPELAELRERAEATERLLRETTEEVAALRRQMANLVAVREELPKAPPALSPPAQWGPLAAARMPADKVTRVSVALEPDTQAPARP